MTQQSTTVPPAIDRDVLYAKVAWRLLPLLMTCYVFAYLDRVNIGFAKAGLEQDLGINDARYGFAAGVFFLGYVLFEIPSNLVMTRIGARRTFVRIMVLWGLAAMGMALVTTPTQLYVVRFLLGVFEAGFAPGMIFFLTLWFPAARMARVMGLVMLAVPFASVIGAPLSAAMITGLDGVAGLQGWQWMFLLQGLPCLGLAAVVARTLADSPREAAWLEPAEKQVIAHDITVVTHSVSGQLRDVLRMPAVYLMAGAFFAIIGGIYAMNFWLPTILADAGVADVWLVGVLVAVPYVFAMAGMVVVSRHSDRTGERCWHIVVPTLVAAAALGVAAFASSVFVIAYLAIVVGTTALFVAYTIFWSVPSSIVTGTAAAAAVAAVNSVGLLGGFFSPTLIGVVRESTGSTRMGLAVMVALLVLAAILFRAANPPRLPTTPATSDTRPDLGSHA
jgi:MFS family permease